MPEQGATETFIIIWFIINKYSKVNLMNFTSVRNTSWHTNERLFRTSCMSDSFYFVCHLRFCYLTENQAWLRRSIMLICVERWKLLRNSLARPTAFLCWASDSITNTTCLAASRYFTIIYGFILVLKSVR